MHSHVLKRRDANSCTYTRTSARIVSRLMTAHDAWTRSVIEKKIKRLENRVDMLNEEKMKLLAESHGDGRPAEGDDGSGEDDENYETDEEDDNQDAEELETSEAEERPRTRLQGERDRIREVEKSPYFRVETNTQKSLPLSWRAKAGAYRSNCRS